jgi:hypothetical protein
MPCPAPISCRNDQENDPLRVAQLASPGATSLGSDHAPTKVIQLARQRRGEACPGIVLFPGKLIDFPGHLLRNHEGDVALVAPLSVFWQAITQEVGDLADVVPVSNPAKRLSFVRCQGQGC